MWLALGGIALLFAGQKMRRPPPSFAPPALAPLQAASPREDQEAIGLAPDADALGDLFGGPPTFQSGTDKQAKKAAKQEAEQFKKTTVQTRKAANKAAEQERKAEKRAAKGK